MTVQNEAVIDLGSNTAILLIYQNAPKFKVVHEAFLIPRLAQGLMVGGEFLPEAMVRVVQALQQFQTLMHEHRAQLRICGGTAPFRKVADPKGAIQKLQKETGIKIEVLSEADEAFASYLSAVSLPSLLNPDEVVEQACVMDIGGGSCEIAWGSGPRLEGFHSLPIGCVDSTEKILPSQLQPTGTMTSAELKKAVALLAAKFPNLAVPKGAKFFAVAGTPVALGLLELGKTSYQPHWVDGLAVPMERVHYWLEIMAGVPLREKIERYGILQGRAEVLVSGLIFLSEAMRRYGFKEVVVRNAGLRYGLALQALSKPPNA